MSSSKGERIYWGSLPSQYDTLDPESEEKLEEAIRISTCCSLSDALQSFSQLDHLHPVVAFEIAEMHNSRRRYGPAAQALEVALHAAPKVSLDDDIFRCLAMFLGHLEIYWKGTLQRACVEQGRVRGWLAEVPVSKYTDVQIACLRSFFVSDMLMTMFTNQRAQENSSIPKCDRENEHWQGLQDLRRELLCRHQFRAALAVTRMARLTVPLTQRDELFRTFVETIDEFLSASDPTIDKLLWVKAVAYDDWATALRQSGNFERVSEVIKELGNVLDQFVACNGILKESLNLHLCILGFQIDVLPETEFSRIYDAAMGLLPKLKSSNHRLLSDTYILAADNARKMFKKTGHPEWECRFYSAHIDLEKLQIDELGDAHGRLLQYEPVIIHETKQGVHSAAVLRWFRKFEEQNPHFALPAPMVTIAWYKKIIYDITGDLDGQRQVVQELKDWLPLVNRDFADSFDRLQGASSDISQGGSGSVQDLAVVCDHRDKMIEYWIAGSKSDTNFLTELSSDSSSSVPEVENAEEDFPTEETVISSMEYEVSNCPCYGVTDALKNLTEVILKSPLSWWPLSQPRKPLRDGWTRVFWTCKCGERLHDDIPLTSATKFFPSLSEMPNEPATLTTFKKKQPTVVLNHTSLSRFIRLSTIASSEPCTSSGADLNPIVNQVDATVIIPTLGNVEGINHQEQATPGATGETSITAQSENIVPVIYVSVDTGINQTVASGVELTPGSTDRDAFRLLNDAYLALSARSRFKWTHATGIRFFRFVRYLHKSNQHFVDPNRDQDRYPSPTNSAYEYNPKPMPEDMFMRNEIFHYFTKNEDCGTSSECISLIPVRVKGHLPGGRRRGYGLHVEERCRALVLAGLLSAILVLAAVGSTIWFVPLWIGNHPGDWQNATALPMVIISVVSAFIGIFRLTNM